VSKKKPNSIKIHYQKNSSYREIHVDGCIGGITPRSLININFYAERFPIPKEEEFAITDNKIDFSNKFRINKDGKEGLIREVECGVYMDIKTATSLMNWLKLKIDEFNVINNESNSRSKK